MENLLAKAAVSPFTLLGSMFGGGEEMSFVDFDPGQSTIPTGETNKLDKLAKSLYERPEVTVDITGSVDPAKDRDTIAHAKFEQRLKAMLIKEMTDAGAGVHHRRGHRSRSLLAMIDDAGLHHDFGPLTNTVSTAGSAGTNAAPIFVASAPKPALAASKPLPVNAPEIPNSAARLMAMSHPIRRIVMQTVHMPPVTTNSVPEAATPTLAPGSDDLRPWNKN